MEFRNHTPFSALNYFMLDKERREYHVVAVKIGYHLIQDTHNTHLMSVIDRNVIPLCIEDEYRGKISYSQVLQESDLAPVKPRCDVIINGTAYAPGGIASEQFPVSVHLTTPDDKVLLGKSLLIRGESEFQLENAHSPFARWKHTSPSPFTALELDYAHAFGGECRIDKDNPDAGRLTEKMRLTETQLASHPDMDAPPIAHTAYSGNPLGCGYTEPWFQQTIRQGRYSAPRIISTDNPFTVNHFTQLIEGTADLSQPVFQPAGLGIVGRAWQPRLSLAGTYDDKWLKERHPYLPDDFNFGYWNCTPADQQINFPPPGSYFELKNLTPEGVLTFTLPEHVPLILLRMENGALIPQPMLADTVLIDTHLMQVWITCRYVLPVVSKTRVMELRYETQPDLLLKKMFPHREI